MNATRAYWELRAEQVMDRVFDPAALELGGRPRPEPEDASIEVEVRPLPPTLPSRWLILGCGGLACLALALGIAWRQAQQDLRQERTVRLLEAPLHPTDVSDAGCGAVRRLSRRILPLRCPRPRLIRPGSRNWPGWRARPHPGSAAAGAAEWHPAGTGSPGGCRTRHRCSAVLRGDA